MATCTLLLLKINCVSCLWVDLCANYKTILKNLHAPVALGLVFSFAVDVSGRLSSQFRRLSALLIHFVYFFRRFAAFVFFLMLGCCVNFFFYLVGGCFVALEARRWSLWWAGKISAGVGSPSAVRGHYPFPFFCFSFPPIHWCTRISSLSFWLVFVLWR